jgi:hypothetical protein
LAATEYLHPLLKESSKKLANRNSKRRKKGSKENSSGSKGSSWRADPTSFHSGKHIPEGWVNISPAWFQQGHEVSVSACWFVLIGSLF